MPTQRPLRPIKEKGRLIDKEAEEKRKQFEQREAWGTAIFYVLSIATYPFIRAYVNIKSFFVGE